MDLVNIARKWQSSWDFTARPEPGKSKYFVTVPFPYPISPLHLDYARAFVSADVKARYVRMKGFSVLFPVAFQYTGTPITALSEAVKRGDTEVITTLSSYGIPREEIVRLSGPKEFADFFSKLMEEDMRLLGLSVDWSRKFNTLDPRFESLIHWQYKKLLAKGLVEAREDYLPFCPRDNYAVGMHDTKGYVEPKLHTVPLILFKSGNLIFPATSPRLETALGGAAILLNPGSTYVIVEESGRNMVLSSRAAYKLSFQRSVKITGEVRAEELVGRKAVNPLTGEELPVLPSKYVNPSMGTGITVASPAHEPFDFIALEEQGIEFSPTPVIRTEGLPEIPSLHALSSGTRDPAILKEYAEAIYREEYYKGVIREDAARRVRKELVEAVGDLSGLRVPEARKVITSVLRRVGAYESMMEISNSPVYCRCGAEVIVKRVAGQWFVKYSQEEWRRRTLEILSRVKVTPESFRRDIAKRIEESEDIAIARSRGIGPRIPWDSSQVFESLSDSTLYTVFYTVSHRIRSTPPDDFWERLLSGEDELSQEFKYWYPVDVRFTEAYLVLNHIPFMLFHHSALLPDMEPREIAVVGSVRYSGRKGSQVPVRDLVNKYGPDVVRLALASSSLLGSDVDLSERLMDYYKERLEALWGLWEKCLSSKGVGSGLDKWLSSLMEYYVRKLDFHYSTSDFHSAAEILLRGIPRALETYFKLTEDLNRDLLLRILSAWVRAVAPLAPHVAEEIWHRFKDSYVSLSPFPTPEEFSYSAEDLLKVEYALMVAERVAELMKAASGKRVVIYVNDEGEADLSSFPEYLREAMSAVKLREKEALLSLKVYLEKLIGLPLEIYGVWEDVPDFKGKKRLASPMNPGIAIVP
jgi:leucyl-tRNA synthetase